MNLFLANVSFCSFWCVDTINTEIKVILTVYCNAVIALIGDADDNAKVLQVVYQDAVYSNSDIVATLWAGNPFITAIKSCRDKVRTRLRSPSFSGVQLLKRTVNESCDADDNFNILFSPVSSDNKDSVHFD